MPNNEHLTSGASMPTLNEAAKGNPVLGFTAKVAIMRELHSFLSALSKCPDFTELKGTLRVNNQAVLLSDPIGGRGDGDSPYGGWVRFLALTGGGPRIVQVACDSFDDNFEVTRRPVFFELKGMLVSGLTLADIRKRLDEGVKVKLKHQG